ncbi:MAG: histidine phosphatase family protein [Myxococcales bacterium]|nr:histidine phosphatase family protein [Myxococcales bacterium]
MTHRLYLLRHGEPARRDIFYGHHDIHLSERGLAQAQAQAAALAPLEIAALHASDLTRARVGGEAVAARGADRPPLRCVPALREMHLGVLEEQPFAAALATYPEHARLRYEDMLDVRLPGGGESVRDVADRVIPWIRGLVREHPDGGRPRNLVLVTHNTVIRILLAFAAGLGAAGYTRFAPALGSISRIDVDPGADDIFAGATIALANWRPSLTK